MNFFLISLFRFNEDEIRLVFSMTGLAKSLLTKLKDAITPETANLMMEEFNKQLTVSILILFLSLECIGRKQFIQLFETNSNLDSSTVLFSGII